ncbi:hypothetical protein [Bradyrhizobium sp. SZCCHNRI1073]|uniref:hypothetical protein n=1 Tax=Bradyrhizobium sp. SZCCHNRI1073 TaxID=3057280 RepID=UPI002915FF85|nr:hypothetical protein [Bradyrhizobium sp. SZCCHNRI1073]
MSNEEVEAIVAKAVTETLVKLGIEASDYKEMQADFTHLRRWRKSVEQAQSYTFKAVVTTIAAGVMGAIWLGFQAMLHK